MLAGVAFSVVGIAEVESVVLVAGRQHGFATVADVASHSASDDASQVGCSNSVPA